MGRFDLFHDKPGEQGRDPFWVLVWFFVATILVSYFFSWPQTQDGEYTWVDEHRAALCLFAQESGKLAFFGLIVVLVWFGTHRNWVFAAVLLLVLVNCAQSAWLVDGKMAIDIWEWKLLDAATAVIAAIVLMPAVKWRTRSKRVVSRSVSIADIMLLTMASAVFIASSLHIANVEYGDANQGGFLYGLDGTAEYLVATGLLSLISLAVVYVSYFGRLISGVVVYLLTWIAYIAWVELVTLSELKPVFNVQNISFERLWIGELDHYIPVFALFLLCILIARLVSRFWAKTKQGE